MGKCEVKTKSPLERYIEQQEGKSTTFAKRCPPIEQSYPIIETDENGARAVGARIFGQSFMNALEVGNADRRLGSRIDCLVGWVIAVGIGVITALAIGIAALCS